MAATSSAKDFISGPNKNPARFPARAHVVNFNFANRLIFAIASAGNPLASKYGASDPGRASAHPDHQQV
jgi:hypothetical protein